MTTTDIHLDTTGRASEELATSVSEGNDEVTHVLSVWMKEVTTEEKGRRRAVYKDAWRHVT